MYVVMSIKDGPKTIKPFFGGKVEDLDVLMDLHLFRHRSVRNFEKDSSEQQFAIAPPPPPPHTQAHIAETESH